VIFEFSVVAGRQRFNAQRESELN